MLPIDHLYPASFKINIVFRFVFIIFPNFLFENFK